MDENAAMLELLARLNVPVTVRLRCRVGAEIVSITTTAHCVDAACRAVKADLISIHGPDVQIISAITLEG